VPFAAWAVFADVVLAAEAVLADLPLSAAAVVADPEQADAVSMAAHRTAKLVAVNLFDRVRLRRTPTPIPLTAGAYQTSIGRHRKPNHV
jgi:hypothetical protein